MSNRIRTIKPEWLEDELLALASDGARVLSVALMLLADDYGNGRANLTLLTGRAFPGRLPEEIAPLLDELIKLRYVVLYEVDGQRYFHIRNWSKHQKIDRPSKPRVPEFPIDASLKKPEKNEDSVKSREVYESTRETVASVSGNTSTTAEGARASRGSWSGSIPGPGPGPESEPTACPPDLRLSEAQRGTLQVNLSIPEWGIDAITARFVAKSLGDPNDKRTLEVWRKCLSQAVCSDWNNASRRPQKPTEERTEPSSETRLKRAQEVKARAEAQLEEKARQRAAQGRQ
jgi:hypothetical protein